MREVLLHIFPITFFIIFIISFGYDRSLLLDRSFEQISVPPAERLLSPLLSLASLSNSLSLDYFACLPTYLEGAIVQWRWFRLVCDR